MEIVALLQENAIQLLCTVAVIIGIIAGKVKTAEKAQEVRVKTLKKLKKKESKQAGKLNKTIKKKEKLEKEITKNA